MQVTVQIPNYNQGGAGTLRWLEKTLAEAKITTGRTGENNPGLWIEIAGKKEFLCILHNSKPDSPDDSIRVGEYWVLIPQPVDNRCGYKTGIFNFLTGAAEAKFAEFVQAAAEKFAEQFENI